MNKRLLFASAACLAVLLVMGCGVEIHGKAQKVDLIDESGEVAGFVTFNNPDPVDEGHNLIVVVSLKEGDGDATYEGQIQVRKELGTAVILGCEKQLTTNHRGHGNLNCKFSIEPPLPDQVMLELLEDQGPMDKWYFYTEWVDIDLKGPAGEVTPTLSIGDATVGEDEGSATFTVSLSEASSSTVTVDYATTDGTATASEDYTAAIGTLEWTPGESDSQTISVFILDDDDSESDETFFVQLSNSTNATIDEPTGEGTIIDDDESSPETGGKGGKGGGKMVTRPASGRRFKNK